MMRDAEKDLVLQICRGEQGMPGRRSRPSIDQKRQLSCLRVLLVYT